MGEAAVAVCAPTGLAAANVGGITLDRLMGNRKVRAEWPTGVMSFDDFRQRQNRSTGGATGGATGGEEEEEEDGPYLSKGEVFAPVDTSYTAARLSAARLILIDEVSMVSAAKLELLFVVLDHYGVEWESVQFVCVGDFAQLKPICQKTSPEASAPRGGFFAFRSPAWAELRLVPAPLSVNRRCADVEWNTCLASLRNGQVDEALLECIRGLTAAPTPITEAAAAGSVGIFGRTECVNEFNRLAFETLPGIAQIVEAKDAPTSWGAVPKRLPAALILKAGCSVLVTRNLRDGPYNGASGVMVAADSDGVRVAFDDDRIGKQLVGAVVDSQSYRRDGAEEKGERRQVPLKLATAFTVHKAQGRSISRPLYVDVSTFWQESGMLYVALSRTTDPSTLAIARLDRAIDPPGEQIAYIDPKVLEFHKELEARPLPRWA